MRGVSAERKWQICRELHEHRGVSLELLSEMTGVTMDSVAKHAKDECWEALCGAAALQMKLAVATDACIDRLISSEGSDEGAVLRVRNLKMLSGTLDGLLRSEEKMAQTKLKAGTGRDWNKATDNDAPLSQDGLKRLNRDLQKLVVKIERDRRAGSGGGTGKSGSTAKGNMAVAKSGKRRPAG